MKLTKIAGNTFWIPGPTNVGVFVFKDKYTLLIDSGDNNQDARLYASILGQAELNIKYIINTHEHHDHWGGNHYLREQYPGSVFYASEQTALFIENSFLFPLYIYGGNPPPSLVRGVGGTRSAYIDHRLESGTMRINDEKFDISPARSFPGADRDRYPGKGVFPGGCPVQPGNPGQIRFSLFVGCGQQYQTMNRILDLPYDLFVLGHAERIYTADQIPGLVELNRSRLDHCMELLLDLLQQPKTREELLEEVIILEDLEPDFHEYCLLHSTIGGMISHLMLNSGLALQLENGKAYYYQK